MADTKISALPAAATLDSSDIFPVVTNLSGSPTNKKVSLSVLTSLISVPAGDMTVVGAGAGIIVTTPNGLHTYRIAIGNDGAITTEQLT